MKRLKCLLCEHHRGTFFSRAFGSRSSLNMARMSKSLNGEDILRNHDKLEMVLFLLFFLNLTGFKAQLCFRLLKGQCSSIWCFLLLYSKIRKCKMINVSVIVFVQAISQLINLFTFQKVKIIYLTSIQNILISITQI